MPQIRPYRGYYPIELFEPVKTRKYRGTTIADVRFHPLQYNYDTSTVRAYYRIVYKVSFVGGSMIANMTNISPDDPFLENTTLNHGVFKQSSPQNISSTNNVDVTKNYLIITIPEFLPAVYRLAEWKRMLGYNVIISSQSLWNADGVRAKAQYEYNNNTGGVYYLLIVGGHSLITSWRFQGGEYTDYYYGCIESEYDTSQEIYVGRLPVMTSDEANTVVDKIINYEKNQECADSTERLLSLMEEAVDFAAGLIDAFPEMGDEFRYNFLSIDPSSGEVYPAKTKTEK